MYLLEKMTAISSAFSTMSGWLTFFRHFCDRPSKKHFPEHTKAERGQASLYCRVIAMFEYNLAPVGK